MSHDSLGTTNKTETRQPFSLKLSIPADLRFLAMVQGFVREVSVIAGIPSNEVAFLELASEEALVNIIEHAYPGCKLGDIHLEGVLRESELEITFRDEGIPFSTRPDQYLDSISEDPERGIGFRIMRHATDEVHFENLGRQGKMLRLIKRLSKPFLAGPGPVISEIPPAPEQKYEFRPMIPEDILHVPRLFWFAYGYSYKNENFYRPEGVLHLIGSGHLTSYVAVGANKEVVGHAGLLRRDSVPVAEMALLLVHPAHRGRRIMNSLLDTLTDKAAEMGLHGLIANAVTSHPISQKDIYHLGFIPCGFELAACPPRQFKALLTGDNPPQRESYVHAFLYRIPPSEVTVHLPRRYRSMVAGIYEGLKQRCIMGEPASAASSGDFRIHFDRGLHKGVIRVITADEARWPEILRVAQDMEEMADAQVVNIELPLAQPATALLFDLAEEAGFVFTGIMPCQSPDGDNARLQRICAPFDMENLRIYHGFGEELLAYMKTAMLASRRSDK